MTLIVLLILAGVSLSGLFSEKGLFKRTENASNRYNEAKAREVLETVLLADGQYEKNTNPEYNQDEFLDALIKSEIPGSKVIEDIAIVDGYGYELDRSVPKIGHYLGREEDIVFPELELGTPILTQSKKTATFTITAREDTNGISKIEVWQEESNKETIEFNNEKEKTITYTATRNGKYYVKAYANKTKITATRTTIVTGIVPTVKFEPDGDTTYKKEHTTKVTVEETEDKVKSMKYKWTNTAEEPSEATFTLECNNKGTIRENGVTGTYFAWILVEFESGNKVIYRSEGFNFDNEGPNITSFTASKYSTTGITLSATAQDRGIGTVKFEFYVDDVLKDTETCDTTTLSITQNITITGLSTGSHTCKVVVYDLYDNSNYSTISGDTKKYAWNKYNATSIQHYALTKTRTGTKTGKSVADSNLKSSHYFTCTAEDNSGRLILSNYQSKTFKADYYKNAWYIFGSEAWKCTGESNVTNTGDGMNYTSTFHFDIYKATQSTKTYSKGTTSYGIVTSSSSSAYPTNGEKGGYWYVSTTPQ